MICGGVDDTGHGRKACSSLLVAEKLFSLKKDEATLDFGIGGAGQTYFPKDISKSFVWGGVDERQNTQLDVLVADGTAVNRISLIPSTATNTNQLTNNGNPATTNNANSGTRNTLANTITPMHGNMNNPTTNNVASSIESTAMQTDVVFAPGSQLVDDDSFPIVPVAAGGAFIVICLICALVFCAMRRRKRAGDDEGSAAVIQMGEDKTANNQSYDNERIGKPAQLYGGFQQREDDYIVAAPNAVLYGGEGPSTLVNINPSPNYDLPPRENDQIEN